MKHNSLALSLNRIVYALFHVTLDVLDGVRETSGGGYEGDRLSEDGPKKTPCPQEVTRLPSYS